MPSSRPSPRRARGKVLAAALAIIGLAVLTACASGSGATDQNTTAAPRPPTTTTTTTTHPAPTSHTASAAQKQAVAKAALLRIVHAHPADAISVAAYDVDTGTSFRSGATSGMWTASLYKLFVLEAVLIQAQDNGTQLSSSELSLATPAIENSDNVAGYALFQDAGGNAGVAAAWKQLGLTSSVPGDSDPTFTTTNAQDCITLLKNLVGPTPLSPYSRSLALGLMQNVEADQRWGVGAAADPNTTFANKNGWLSIDDNGPGESDNGLWAVTSAGIVQHNGHQVLLAVMTKHNPDFESGVTLVQQLAEQAAAMVAP